MDSAAAIFSSLVCKRGPNQFEAMGDGRCRRIRGSSVRDVCSSWHLVAAPQVNNNCSRQFDFILTGVPFLSPGCAIFPDGGRQSLEEQPTMDKVVSLLISVGIITFGAWVAAATIAKGWPLVWTLMALFPLLTGFISLYGSIKGTED